MRRKTNQPNFKALTLAKIAARAGVSIPTISRVLHHRPGVAPETRERVEQILKESGFVFSGGMELLPRGSSGIIDIVVPGLTPYSVEIMRGISGVLERTGLRLALSTTGNTVQREQQWLGKVLEGSTDGAILILSHEQTCNLAELQRRGVPFVVVDHEGGIEIDFPSVGATNWAGGRAATEYLLSLGHRRIAVIGGEATFRCSIDRIAGYRAALEEAGMPIYPEYIRPGAFMPQTGYEQTCALLDLPEPPTAIFAGSDLQAMGIYSALRTRGVAIPDTISVVGFDDIPLASMVTPALTTIRQPLIEMGRVATTMLLRLIAAEPLDHPRVALATVLIVRESCASLHP